MTQSFHSTASILAIALLMAIPNVANAEGLAEAADAENAAAQASPSSGDGILVTGTRIARPDLSSPMPVSVVSMEESERFGRTSAYDALLNNPAVSPGTGTYNSYGGGWDSGISSVSLRDLGASRSLTLIDGMRRVSGSAQSSAVDINMIPTGMIERIEVVTGGAAAIYGADAVTGAVNIITKKEYEGGEISGQTGISKYGDGTSTTISGVFGGKFNDNRGSFIIGGTYATTSEIGYLDRRSGWPGAITNPENTGPNDGIPDNIMVSNLGWIYQNAKPSFVYGNKEYLIENGVPRVAGYDSNPEKLFPLSRGLGGDGQAAGDENILRGESKSFAAISRMDYNLTDDLTFTARMDYGRTKYNSAVNTFRDDTRAQWFNGKAGAVVYLDNPYLSDSMRSFMTSNGIQSLVLRRRWSNVPRSRDIHDRETVNLFSGLSGSFLDRFNWNAFAQYGRSTDNVETTNMVVNPNWLYARDAVADPVTGKPVCRDVTARANGCVPFDIFSTDYLTDEQQDYVLASRHERRVNTQFLAGANVEGTLFKLPYGDVSIALGAEHRRETLKTVDDGPESGVIFSGGGSSHPEIGATVNITEFYGEMVVPLLRDLPFVHNLQVEGAYRHSNYSTVGNTNTWKAGGIWAPIEGLTFRGVRSRSVRVPNFGELYGVRDTRVTSSLPDPCMATGYYLNATRTANCKALGINTPHPVSYDAAFVTTGGNPDLKPETSNSLTLGAVFQPKFMRNVDFTVDYWDIDIKNVITSYSLSNVLSLCVDLPSIDNSFCKAVTRDSEGKIQHVNTTYLNAAALTARGIDFGVNYRTHIGEGRFSASLKGTYLIHNITKSTPGIATGNVQNDDKPSSPHLRGSLVLAYDIGKVSVALGTKYIGKVKYDPNVSDEYYSNNNISSRVYNNISVLFDLDRIELGGGIKNIFNVKPEHVSGITTGSNGVYDIIGQYFFVTAKVKL